MTRAEFLNSLYRRLGALEKEQAEQYLTYYAEMLMDRMEEGMSEAEAVASMEDVETIASRILQDEGRADAPKPPQAPQFPDMPKGEAGQFTHVPVKPKQDWRKITQAALWAIAAIVVVHTVGTRLTSRQVAENTAYTTDSTSTVVEEAIQVSPGTDFGMELSQDEVVIDCVTLTPDGITVAGGEHEVCIGPQGIYAYGQESDVTSAWGAAGEIWEAPLDEVNSIYVDWQGGEVSVQSWDGGSIRFREFGGKLKESQKLQDEVINGQLTIRDGGSGKSKLLLLVPQAHMMDSIYINGYSWDIHLDNVAVDLWIDTTSGNVTLRDVAAQNFTVSTSSGDVVLDSAGAETAQISTSSGYVQGMLGASQTAWVETASGDIDLTTGGAYELNVDTTSGNVGLGLIDPKYVSIDTASGDVNLIWPWELGFILGFESASGTVGFRSDIETVRTGDGYYYYADSGDAADLQVSTISGDLFFG